MKRILYIFAFVFVLTVLMSVSALAATDSTYTYSESNFTEEVTFTDENGVIWKAKLDIDGKKAMIAPGIVMAKIEDKDGKTVDIRTENVNIPSVIPYNGEDYPVTQIGEKAFQGKTLLFGKLTLPETLEAIGDYAFQGTNIYGEVILHDSIRYIGAYSFSGCMGIFKVKIPSDLKIIPVGAFKECLSLTEVYSDSNTVIERFENFCFELCPALNKVNIGPGTTYVGVKSFHTGRGLDGILDLTTVTHLDAEAFVGCFNIIGVKLPDKLDKTLDLTVFKGCNKIASYEVSNNNESYTTVDGVLYNKQLTILYRYPIEKTDLEFTIIDSVEQIYKDAFSGAYHLGKINFNKKIKKIGDSAFKDTGIEFMFIPDTVDYLGAEVLADCSYLEMVVISNQIDVAVNIVKDSPNVTSVIGRHVSFDISKTGNPSISKCAADFTCTSHIYGYLDDTATCTESGVSTCIICDRKSYVKPTGHQGAIVSKHELTCTTDSYIVVDCTKCGDPYAKTIYEKAPGHVSSPKTVKVNDALKFTIESCSVCNETIISNYIASFYLIGDINNDGLINNDDTALLAEYIGGKTINVNKLSCDINGDYEIDIYDLILLKRFVAKIDQEINTTSEGCTKHLRVRSYVASEISCTTDGIKFYYCLDCGNPVYTETEKKPGHTWEYSTTIKATCKGTGFSSVTCSVCKVNSVLYYDKLPHTQSWWTMPDNKGYEYSICDVCGVFEHRAVDYSEFDALIAQLPQYYEVYFSQATLTVLNPIIKNHSQTLTQEQVNDNVAKFKECMSRIEYDVKDVPVIYINSIGDFKLQSSIQGNTPTVNAEIIVAYRDENGVYNDYVETNGEAKVRGNSTANPGKKPYNIKFSTNVDLFGMGEDNKYCLLANAYEPTLMRNALVRYFNDICGLDFACKFEFVYVYVDGVERGSYLLCTPIDVEETRVNIDKETDAVLEIEESFGEGDFYFNGGENSIANTPFFNIRFQVADGNDLSGEGYSILLSTIYQLEYAIMSGNWEEVQNYADIDSLLRYYILVDYFKDTDFNWDSTRFYIQDGKLHGGPAWDYDRALGHVNRSTGRGNYTNMSDFTVGVYGDSTTGEWANSQFLGYPDDLWKYTFSDSNWVQNPSSMGSHPNHTWLTYLYDLYPEFGDELSEYIIDLSDEMAVMYRDVVDTLGKKTMNVIDQIFTDDNIYKSFARDEATHKKILYDSGEVSVGEGSPYEVRNGLSIIYTTRNEAIEDLRSWLKQRHQWIVNHYAGEEMAQYCAELADKTLKLSYGEEISTLLTSVDGENIFTVNVPIASEKPIGTLEKVIFNEVNRIFTENLSYATIIVNLTMNGEIVSNGTYSTQNVLEETMSTVESKLKDPQNNAHADKTSVEFTEVNGIFTVRVFIDNASIAADRYHEHQKSLYDIIKKEFEKANVYVSVDIIYRTNTEIKRRYINNLFTDSKDLG